MPGIFAERVLGGLLFEVRPTDPLPFAGVLLLPGGVALTASCPPARRATRIEPLAALRHSRSRASRSRP